MKSFKEQDPRKAAWWQEGNTVTRSDDHLVTVLTDIYPIIVDALSTKRSLSDEDVAAIASEVVDRVCAEYKRGKTYRAASFTAVVKATTGFLTKAHQAAKRYSRDASLDELMAARANEDNPKVAFQPVANDRPTDDLVVDQMYVEWMLSHPSLTESEHEVISLRYLEGMGISDIAEYCGTLPNAIHQRIFRAINRLRSIDEEG